MSLVRLLKGETTLHRDIVFADHAGQPFICRNGRYKFVLNCARRDLDELYDLQADPGELRNLAYVPEHKALADKMTQRILAWLRETNHPYAEVMAKQAARSPTTNTPKGAP